MATIWFYLKLHEDKSPQQPDETSHFDYMKWYTKSLVARDVGILHMGLWSGP